MVITLTGATDFHRKASVLPASGGRPRTPHRVPEHRPGNVHVGDDIASAVEGADGVIHLAGGPVARRWNDDVKRRILDSRVQTTRKLVEAIGSGVRKPATLVSASAVGYYGDRGEEILTERSAPGSGFLPEVCVQWEREAGTAERSGVRTAMIRIGIVLGPNGGALQQMLPPFRLGVGGGTGRVRSGCRGSMLTISSRCCVRADERSVRGPVNGVAPEPVRNSALRKRSAALYTGRPFSPSR